MLIPSSLLPVCWEGDIFSPGGVRALDLASYWNSASMPGIHQNKNNQISTTMCIILADRCIYIYMLCVVCVYIYIQIHIHIKFPGSPFPFGELAFPELEQEHYTLKRETCDACHLTNSPTRHPPLAAEAISSRLELSLSQKWWYPSQTAWFFLPLSVFVGKLVRKNRWNGPWGFPPSAASSQDTRMVACSVRLTGYDHHITYLGNGLYLPSG